MAELLTPSNITFTLGLLGVIFTVYNSFRNPQIKADKADALFAQQLKFFIESNDRRFAEIQKEIKDAMTLGQNHIHTVDTKVDVLAQQVAQMGKEIVKLGTIIEERVPKGRQP